MARQLKVFVVPAGFHDAYVAAPSRKAALEAWGSEHDLFARGIAQQVTDPALTAEPLAHPGEVIKRSRGTNAEQIAALPVDVERVAETESGEADATPRKTKAPAKPPVKVAKPRPKPSRDALEAAERAAADADDKHRDAEAEIAARQATLDRELRKLSEAHRREQKKLAATLADERERYDRAMKRWREG